MGIGDFALAPSNPDILYVGTGESLKKGRNFTMHGTGIYRSDDAGSSWRHCGLDDSWQIGEIAIHPQDPDIVLVSVLGHFWSKNENRGVYRTLDGGKTWEQVLYLDDRTGANDIVISPSDPDIIYASMWENYPDVSGPNSSVYRSTDGGATWVACNHGLPGDSGTGRMGLAVSHTNPDKAYLLVDNRSNENGAAAEVYRTLDGGQHWERTHREDLKIFSGIGWYFADIYVGPENDDEIFTLGVRMAHSEDGGKSFSIVGGDVARMTPSAAQGLHLDHCELWINPLDSEHLALGNDGGLYISYDKGRSWMHYNNIPAGEFYDITLDHQTPYRIYGGTQDDATVFGPPTEWNPRFPDPWQYLWIDAWNGGDGCVTQVDPKEPNTVYFSLQHGAARRLDRSVDSSVSIMPELPEGSEDSLMYNFVSPYFISPHHSKTLYHAGNFVFKSMDRGDHWEKISGDLSQSSVASKRSIGAGALAESPLQAGLLYMGTDRGAFWVSHDDGQSWEEQSNGIADHYIRSICASRYHKERVYMAMSGVNYDDLGKTLYVSENYGKNWRSLNANLPDEPANVILEDPTNENILYAGLYRGVYVSTDRGFHWSYLGKNMPDASIADLEIDEPTMDLVAATHGRGIYKMNVKAVQEGYLNKSGLLETHFFELPPVRRPWHNDTHGEANYRTLQRLPITFWLTSAGEVSLELINEEHEVVWTTRLDGTVGFNEYRWDLVIKREESDQPYFIHHETFLDSGIYEMKLLIGTENLVQELTVLEGISPNLD